MFPWMQKTNLRWRFCHYRKKCPRCSQISGRCMNARPEQICAECSLRADPDKKPCFQPGVPAAIICAGLVFVFSDVPEPNQPVILLCLFRYFKTDLLILSLLFRTALPSCAKLHGPWHPRPYVSSINSAKYPASSAQGTNCVKGIVICVSVFGTLAK